MSVEQDECRLEGDVFPWEMVWLTCVLVFYLFPSTKGMEFFVWTLWFWGVFQPFSSETQLANTSNSVSSPKTCRRCVSPAKQCLPLSISVRRPESAIRWLSVSQIIQSCGLCCIVQKSLWMPYVWRIHGRWSIKWSHVVWTSPSHCLSYTGIHACSKMDYGISKGFMVVEENYLPAAWKRLTCIYIF